jgi:hypothetical protein
MNECPKMEATIKRLAEIFGFDLKAPRGTMQLTIDQEGIRDLTVEKMQKNQISVAQYYTVNVALVPEPDILFYMGPTGWIPTAIGQSVEGWEHCASVDGKLLRVKDSSLCTQIAAMAEEWADVLAERYISLNARRVR